MPCSESDLGIVSLAPRLCCDFWNVLTSRNASSPSDVTPLSLSELAIFFELTRRGTPRRKNSVTPTSLEKI